MKTTTKRAAFVASTVQKTPTYPIDENYAQSTMALVMRPSANSKTMTATITPMRLKSMLLTRRAVRQGLTAAAVWVNDGNWRQARAVVRRKLSFGLAFPGDRRTDDNLRLLSLLGQAYPKRGIRPSRVCSGSISASE